MHHVIRQADDQRWKTLAAQYREVAERLPHGKRRDGLLKKAMQLKTASHAGDWANSTALQPPVKKSK
jgi:hypothetical protein